MSKVIPTIKTFIRFRISNLFYYRNDHLYFKWMYYEIKTNIQAISQNILLHHIPPKHFHILLFSKSK